uniref:Uncharacterized protein n=1 Tax=Glossina pallidipes TaxID=7398 RepID=A0A1A9ZC65_GLOPL
MVFMANVDNVDNNDDDHDGVGNGNGSMKTQLPTDINMLLHVSTLCSLYFEVLDRLVAAILNRKSLLCNICNLIYAFLLDIYALLHHNTALHRFHMSHNIQKNCLFCDNTQYNKNRKNENSFREKGLIFEKDN